MGLRFIPWPLKQKTTVYCISKPSHSTATQLVRHVVFIPEPPQNLMSYAQKNLCSDSLWSCLYSEQSAHLPQANAISKGAATQILYKP